MVGLAKRLEEVFVPGNPDAQVIHKDSLGLILLRRVRDEAHRFAVSFQRDKRSRAMLESPLLKIKGIGDKTIEKLFIEFNGSEELACQSPDDISKKIGVSIKLSKEIIKISKRIAK